MDTTEAYQILKESIELDETTIGAYKIVIENSEDYINTIKIFCNEIKSSLILGQSLISMGELVRQFYNATHRQINDEIISLPGANFCKEVGEVANVSIQKTIEINQMTEEYATTQLSCNETTNTSYM